MAFKIAFRESGRDNYLNCLGYVAFELENIFAAESLNNDILKTLESLRLEANSHALCENPNLKSRGLRKIHLKHHSYKIFYSVEENTVWIEAILHDKQDFENKLI